MTTIEAKIPEPVLKQAEELAQREKITVKHLISLAVAQAVGVWSNESYLAARAKRGNRDRRNAQQIKCPCNCRDFAIKLPAEHGRNDPKPLQHWHLYGS